MSHISSTLRFALQSTARLHLVEIAVDVGLEENCWVIGRPAGDCWLCANEAQPMELQLIDEYVNDSNRLPSAT